jgi:hypothetical protein
VTRGEKILKKIVLSQVVHIVISSILNRVSTNFEK